MVGTATIMPTMPTPLGTLIANERQRLNWSLRDVTAHGGPRHNTLSYIEAGKVVRPDAETLWRIAGAFAVGSSKVDTSPIEAGEWFARLLRTAGYPLDADADAAVARLVSVLSEDKRRIIAEMTPEELETLLNLWRQARGGPR
jgi:transcriptional regulator with XRE-family HTH domain